MIHENATFFPKAPVVFGAVVVATPPDINLESYITIFVNGIDIDSIFMKMPQDSKELRLFII